MAAMVLTTKLCVKGCYIMKEFIKIKKQELFINELLQELKKSCEHFHGIVVYFTLKLDNCLNYDCFAITKIEKGGKCNYHDLIAKGYKNEYCTFIGPVYYKDIEDSKGYETEFIIEFI